MSVKAFGHPADALLVGVRHHEHPVVAQELLEHHDLADALETAGRHDIEGLVEHDLAAGGQLARVDRGRDCDPHLATTGEDVDGGIVVGLDDQAVGRRRLGQPVNLTLEGDDLLARFSQRPDEAFVLGRQGRQRGLQLQYAVLEVTGTGGRVREATAKAGDLLGQQGLLAQGLRSVDRLDRGLVLVLVRRVLGHRRHLLAVAVGRP